MTGRKNLEAMTASLWNNLQVCFRQNVRYAVYCFVIHTKLRAVVLAFVSHVFIKSKWMIIPVQRAEKRALECLKTRD